MFLAYEDENNVSLVANIAPGVTLEQAAEAMGLAPGSWREITAEEAAELQKPTLAESRAAALESLRLRKWEAKNAGITVNGIAIDTDDRGQATISGAVMNVMLDPAFTVRWKTAAVDENGASVWMTLDGPMLVGLSKAMTTYTEACFAVEAAKQADIAALADVDAIQAWLMEKLSAGWPSREITLEDGHAA